MKCGGMIHENYRGKNAVDELSLALALREDADERVEEAVEEMLNNLWRKIDGNRD